MAGSAVAADVSGFELAVETTPGGGTFTPVYGVDKFSRKGTRSSTKRPVFGLTTDLESTGRLEETYTFSGVLSLNDAGQTIIRTASKAGTQVLLRFTTNGTDGYTRPFKFTDDGSDFSADSDLGDFNMGASPKGDYALVGVGVYF